MGIITIAGQFDIATRYYAKMRAMQAKILLPALLNDSLLLSGLLLRR